MQCEPERDRWHGALSGIHCECLAFRWVRARKHRLTHHNCEALDRETRTKIKEAERTLERVLKHKKADKLTPVDVNAINTAREALSAVAAPLVARWESEKA